jgi:iron complex outermembrane recepter protein
MKTIHLQVTCTPLIILLSAGIALGQQAPAQSQSPTPDDPIELSPFVVSTDSDVGYIAGNTVAGSRFNTPLDDTPSAISVMTSEFLADIGAFNLSEALDYAVNVEVFEDDDRVAMNDNAIKDGFQSYRVRGMSATTARNYFSWDVPTETAFVERIEESRGPNSVLFGIASPGGLINANTKQARFGRAFQRTSFTAASHHGLRATLDVNQPLGDKLALRANLVYNDNKSFRHFAYEKHKRGHISATYRLTENTRLRAEYEKGRVQDNAALRYNALDGFMQWEGLGRPTYAANPSAAIRNAQGIAVRSTGATAPRFTYFSNTDAALPMRGRMFTDGPNNVITDTRIVDYSVNVGGPLQNRTADFNVISAFIEHRFSDKTFLELAFNHQDLEFDRPALVGSPTIHGDPNQLLPTGAPNPFAGRLFFEGTKQRKLQRLDNNTGRAMLSQEFEAGKWGNYRFAALGEYEKAFTGGNNWREIWLNPATGMPAFNPDPTSANNLAYRVTYFTEGDWGSYYVTGADLQNRTFTDPVSGQTVAGGWGVQSVSESYLTRKSAMIAGQARFFKGRLVVAGGYRWDNINEYNKGWYVDPVTRDRTIARNDADATNGLLRAENSANTNTLGLVYHVTPYLSLFANRADNLELPARLATTQPPGGLGERIPVPPPKGESRDVGIRVKLLDNRISARATYYQTKGANQSRTGPNFRTTGIPLIMEPLLMAGLIAQAEYDERTADFGSRGLFDHESEGTELQVSANATKNWRFQISFAEAKAVESNIFREWIALEQATLQRVREIDAANPGINVFNIPTALLGNIQGVFDDMRYGTTGLESYTAGDGLGKLGNRRYKMSLFTRYGIDRGPLKGAYIGGGYRHQSKMFIGLDDNLNKLYGNSFWYADALAGYSTRLGKGRRLSFQLNVRNVFDKRDPLVIRLRPDHETIRRFVIQPPRTWRLSTNFEF